MAAGAGFAGLVVIFVWINLAIVDWFATGETLVTVARAAAARRREGDDARKEPPRTRRRR